jgi:lipopolysaccharide assembly outer membrane protein LptD (OstA)
MIQRSRLYAEAIKRHDSQTERRKGLLISGAGTTSDLGSFIYIPYYLITVQFVSPNCSLHWQFTTGTN